MKLQVLAKPVVLFFAAFLCSLAQGQTSQGYLNDTGSPAYSVQIPVENGFINVSNGNLHLEFPLASPPQRGSLSVSERLTYDSRIWMFSPFGTPGHFHWWPYNVYGASTTSGGWQFVTSGEVGAVTYGVAQRTPSPCGGNGDPGDGGDGGAGGVIGPGSGGGGGYSGPYDTQSSSVIIWTDPAGTVRQFNAAYFTDHNDCDPTQNTQWVYGGSANDGSGYNIPSDSTGTVRILDANGTQVYPIIADRYGNFLSKDNAGNLMDDTGRVPVTVTQNGSVTFYDVLAPGTTNGVRLRYTVTTAAVNVSTTFKVYDARANPLYPWISSEDFQPVQSILLPDGVSKYSFSYDNNGELVSMTLPTGGVISYAYADFTDSSSTENMWLSSHKVGNDPAMTFTPSVKTSCSSYGSGCVEFVKVHKPSGDETGYELTLANGAWTTGFSAYTGPLPGPAVRTPQDGVQLTVINSNTYSNACTGYCYGANYITDSVSTAVIYASKTPALYSQTQTHFDATSGKPLWVKEWGYSSNFSQDPTVAPSTTPTRETDYTYTGHDPYQVTILDSSGNKAAQTTYTYTTNASPTYTVTQKGLQNAGGPYLQSVAHWLNTDVSHPSTTSYSMDDSGMVIGTTDPNNNPATTITYQCDNSLPLQVSNALGQPTQWTYDCASGALTALKTANDAASSGPGTTYAYEAVMGRPYTVTRPDNGTTTYTYPSMTEVDTTTTATPSPSITTKSILDAFGRPSSSIVANIKTDTAYDVNGRVACVTNPYSTSSTGTTCTTYDGMDRPLVQTLQDGSTRSTTYTANISTSTDERGTAYGWSRTSDAFGKLLSVTEPAPTGTAITSYAYDGLGILSGMTQFGVVSTNDVPRSRTFTHDSLGRLICASNPESAQAVGFNTAQPACPISAATAAPSGAIAYSYYADGSVKTKTDARGVTTTFGYDTLNRLVSKTYSDGTPTATLIYDQATVGNFTAANPIGRLVAMTNGLNASTQFSYDLMGRITAQGNTLPRDCCVQPASQISAAYDEAGHLTDLYYPDGVRHIKQSWDAAGRLASVGEGSATQTYLQSMTQNLDTLTDMMGLGNGVVQTVVKNNRLQPWTENVTALLPPTNGQNFLSHTYCYVNCSTGGTANNGSIWGITDTLNSSRTQGFTHDSLNRITAFSLAGQTVQQYQSDTFGNMSGLINGAPAMTFDSATNRISNLPCAQTVTPAFDASGNQLCDSDTNGLVRKYTYDAENRMTAVGSTSSVMPPFETYTYGADGNRIRKTDTDGQTDTEYIYFNGHVIAERDQNLLWTDYIYAGGSKIARVSQSDKILHTKGTFTGTWNEISWSVPVPTNGNGSSYIVKTGDLLCFRQYTNNAVGGIGIWFSNGQWTPWQWSDSDGSTLNQFSSQGVWANRCTDLTWNGTTVGTSVTSIGLLTDVNTGPGNWDIWYSDMSIISHDGTVTQIPLGGVAGSAWGTSANSNYIASSLTAVMDGGPDGTSTHYYLADHLGTAQMEFSSGGWPVWQGQFGPFGVELDTQQTANKYKYTGLERDTVTQFDHTQFRQFAFLQGRWTSPDPYDGSMNPADPQSLNRYSYVGNMPLRFTDVLGLQHGDPLPTSEDDDDCGLVCDIFTLGAHAIESRVRTWFGLSKSFSGTVRARPGNLTFHYNYNNPVLMVVNDTYTLQTFTGELNYHGPPDLAITGGLLIPIKQIFRFGNKPAYFAVGPQFTYDPKTDKLCGGLQLGVEENRTYYLGALISSKGQGGALQQGLGYSLGANYFRGSLGAAGSFSGKDAPGGVAAFTNPGVGASGAVTISACTTGQNFMNYLHLNP